METEFRSNETLIGSEILDKKIRGLESSAPDRSEQPEFGHLLRYETVLTETFCEIHIVWHHRHFLIEYTRKLIRSFLSTLKQVTQVGDRFYSNPLQTIWPWSFETKFSSNLLPTPNTISSQAVRCTSIWTKTIPSTCWASQRQSKENTWRMVRTFTLTCVIRAIGRSTWKYSARSTRSGASSATIFANPDTQKTTRSLSPNRLRLACWLPCLLSWSLCASFYLSLL